MKPKKSVGVFCGASESVDEHWFDLASALGELIASQNIRLVYGGGRVGLMGRMADSCLAAGGEVCGVITDKLMEMEVGHAGLTSLEIMPTMSSRRDRMVALSDTFVALPGGVGTLDELFEVIALRDLKYHSKSIGLLNAFGYYDELLCFLEKTSVEGFVTAKSLSSLVVESDLKKLFLSLHF
jgi:uncharacterized protein (TIGR00730 family)